jgi:hypothetical protein
MDRDGKLFATMIAATLISICPPALAQIPPSDLGRHVAASTPAQNVERFESAAQDLNQTISTLVSSGQLGPRSVTDAMANLENIRVQARELEVRDGGLNATDLDFLQTRLLNLRAALTPPAPVAATPAISHPVYGNLSVAEVPQSLVCNGKRVLLSIGDTEASASVQKYEDVDVSIMTQAIAISDEPTGSMSLILKAPNGQTEIQAAHTGAYLIASSEKTFALPARKTALIKALVKSQLASARSVKIWASCRERD